MEENDIQNILEEIQLLKKEQEKLREENIEVKKENKQLKEFLKEKSIILTNEDFQEYKESSDSQNKDMEELFEDNIELFKEDLDYNMEFSAPQKLYSIAAKPKQKPHPNINNNYETNLLNKNLKSDDRIKIKRSQSLDPYNEYDARLQAIKSYKLDNDYEEKDDMSIISFLARSDKRVQILKSLTSSDKIPSMISKEIGDSSHHVSKYLKTLKEKELVICLNEEDKRFRFYSITPKGKKYLKIIEEEKY